MKPDPTADRQSMPVQCPTATLPRQRNNSRYVAGYVAWAIHPVPFYTQPQPRHAESHFVSKNSTAHVAQKKNVRRFFVCTRRTRATLVDALSRCLSHSLCKEVAPLKVPGSSRVKSLDESVLSCRLRKGGGGPLHSIAPNVALNGVVGVPFLRQ